MNAYEIIDKKKKGISLKDEEITFMVEGYLNDTIPDYQFSAFLMAIYFQGMTEAELISLTKIMRDSGKILSHDYIDGRTVDKHSTGGVGDKTSLVVIPIVASTGVKIPKMSGRGLGHTGGTLDKLESIPGFNTRLSQGEIEKNIKEIGAVIIGQSEGLVPADKKIYSLRDVTATVDSIPLIASSIMSKKLASGASSLVLDVKLGSGAFMKNLDQARELAEKMTLIGNSQGMNTSAIISNMNQPLGFAVGNTLEVREVVETLMNKGPSDLTELSLELASHMIHLALELSLDEARVLAKNSLESGRALEKFYEIIEGQGGDISFLEDLEEFSSAKYQMDILATRDGYVSEIDAQKIGLACNSLGAGRLKIEDDIDYSAGLVLRGKIGDFVKKADTLARIQSNDKSKLEDAKNIIEESIIIADNFRKTDTIIDIII